ncbi:hypothetical protein DSO57_1024690 [Entomophthora muscae]|uniref:Uncharacterized protein n=1 Tax=Entomophthora muscae TaxID=34485 RepID=A0ACC2TPZ5_9FUNG|nr:hypothetical protein DSO57_1024690 [Entomophthora muscae]
MQLSIWLATFFVLKEFGTFAGHSMCVENLVAFYLTAGILASLVRRVVFSAFPHKVSQNFLIPGLGASGAVFGLISFSAYQVPQNPAYIAFLPGVEFKLSELLAFFMTIDFIGVVRGWRLFGHYAHLGGALVGLAYSKWGDEYIWVPINKAVAKIQAKLV